MIEDDYEYSPSLIDYAGEKVMMYKGSQQRFFLYKVIYHDDEVRNYLGVAGPFPINTRAYTSSHEVSGIYFEESYDATKKDELFKAYMESLEPAALKK